MDYPKTNHPENYFFDGFPLVELSVKQNGLKISCVVELDDPEAVLSLSRLYQSDQEAGYQSGIHGIHAVLNQAYNQFQKLHHAFYKSTLEFSQNHHRSFSLGGEELNLGKPNA